MLFSFSQKCLRETEEKIGISWGNFSQLMYFAFYVPHTLYNLNPPWHTSTSERIEWYIEGQAFLRSYYSAPRPSFSSLSHQQVASLSQSSCVSPVQSWIFKESMGARNRGGRWLPYRPARLHRLAEFIPWNRFRGPIRLKIRALLFDGTEGVGGWAWSLIIRPAKKPDPLQKLFNTRNTLWLTSLANVNKFSTLQSRKCGNWECRLC